MTEALLTVVVFVGLLALVPWAVKWIQRRTLPQNMVGSALKVASAVAVGPQQRVVTVEVGPPDARTWLVLGVTSHQVNCLYHYADPSRSAAGAVGAPDGGQAS